MIKTLAAAMAAVIAVPAAAQVPPALQRTPNANPDRINEEQRQRLQQRAAPEFAPPSAPQVEAPPPAEKTEREAPELRFTLTRVDFDHSEYFAKADLQALAQPLIGHEVTLRDLQHVVDQVNALYAARGLTTARAVLPPQQVDTGVVAIRLVEGRIGATTVEGARGRSADFVQAHAALPTEALATPAAIADRLRLFNLNNDAQLRARLVPGAGFGHTDVVLAASQPARVSADVFADNNGFASTGENEVGAVLRGYRLLGGADRATAVFVASRGVRSGNLNLSAPLGDRLRVSATASYGQTHVLFGEVAALGVRGTSLSLGGDMAALLLVNDRITVTGTASVQASRSNTDISGQRVIETRTLTGSVGVLATYAAPGFSVSLQHQIALERVSEVLSDSRVVPVVFQGSGLVSKAIGRHFQGRLRADWQVTTQSNLPGVLQYQIGGSRSSRAFEPGVAAGDRGLSTSAEFAYDAAVGAVQFEPFVFIDDAQTRAPDLNASLQSVGLGLNVGSGTRAQFRVTGATALHSSGITNAGHATRVFFTSTLHF